MEIAPIEVHEELSEEIWPWSREALLAKMTEHAYHGAERVRLVVSSPGGQVASTMTLFTKLTESPIELVTHAKGEIASMGVVLFLAGDKRLASPEATFLMHPITIETPAGWPTVAQWLDVEDIRKLRTKAERSGAHPKLFTELDWGIVRLTGEEREVQRIFEERTNLTVPEIKALVQGHTTVSAAYACAVGIVHEVIPAH
jgi:ATP-dependent protease ClpP protease subunit